MQNTLSTAASEWARCRHFIEKALARSPGFEAIEDVERAIAEGRYQFWPGRNCAAITEIADFPRAKMLIVLHGGGDLAELIDALEPALCAFARAAGCDGIMGLGRKGWERVCETRGYEFGWLAMVKMLRD
jgi:hypothetical protein